MTVSWVSSGSGNWLTAADWSGSTVPGATDDVLINVAGITVTVSSGTLAAAALTTGGSTLLISGGTLGINGTVLLGGEFLESSGEFNLNGSLSTFNDGADQTGGILNLDNGLLVSDADFEENGGTLFLNAQGAIFKGALTETAGLIQLTGNELQSDASFSQTGGTLLLGGSGLFYGSVQQSSGGIIDQTGGVLTDFGSFSESGGTLTLNGSAAEFYGPINIATGTIDELTGGFTSNETLTMSGGSLVMNGNGGVFYGGVTQTAGVISLRSGALTSYDSYVENGGQLNLGDFGGAFNNLSLEQGVIASSAPTLQVSGIFSQSGGKLVFLGRDTTLAGSFNQSAGLIDVQSGALELEGDGTLAGTVTGTGKILVESGSTTISSTASITLTSVEVFGGTLTYAASETINQFFQLLSQGQLATHGETLTLKAAAGLDGEVVGNSSVVVAGGGGFNGLSLDGTSHLFLTSTADETGLVSLGNVTGSRTLFDIEANGKLRIAGNYGFFDQSSNGTLENGGVLEKSGGSGVATVSTNVVSTGAIEVNVGTAVFDGPTSTFGGTISGAGTFALAGGQNSFSNALTLSASRFILDPGQEQLTLVHSLGYKGEWSQEGGTLWLESSFVTVATGGETGLDGGLVTGMGTFSTGSSAPVNASGIDFEGTVTLKAAGAVNQTSNVGFGAQLGSAPILDIGSTAVWTLENNASLGGVLNNSPLQNATITNDGTVQKLNGSSNSYIIGDFINVGKLTVANSVLTLNGVGTIGGTLTGSGSLDLSGTYTLASGLATSIGEIDTIGGTVTLGENLSDAQTWVQSGGEVYLDTNTLTALGLVSLEGGSLSGPGTMIAASATTIGDNYTIGQGMLVIDSTANQVGDITVGDFSSLSGPPQGGTLPSSLATLDIAAGATYTLDDSNNISSNGTLAVAGTFSAFGGGQSVIGPSVVNTGLILDNAAALRFLGPVSGTGSIVIGAGGSLDFVGSVAASTTVSFAAGTGSVLLEDTAPNSNVLSFMASVAGFQSGDFIEFSNLNQNISQVSLTVSGTRATLTDNSGNSDSVSFTSAQSAGSLSVGFGTHGDIALFHS